MGVALHERGLRKRANAWPVFVQQPIDKRTADHCRTAVAGSHQRILGDVAPMMPASGCPDPWSFTASCIFSASLFGASMIAIAGLRWNRRDV
jgi:hypothetical protein